MSSTSPLGQWVPLVRKAIPVHRAYKGRSGWLGQLARKGRKVIPVPWGQLVLPARKELPVLKVQQDLPDHRGGRVTPA